MGARGRAWKWELGWRFRNQCQGLASELEVDLGPEVKVRGSLVSAGGQYLVALHAAEAKAHLDRELR